MKRDLSLWIILVVSVLSFAPKLSAASSAKPNIILILADDLGWTDLGCYGSKFYETPHIDRLAAEGVRFTDAYAASPVCSPTRASLLTGRYPARTHVTDWIPGRTPPGSKLIPPLWTNFLRHEETTIAELLKEAGYVTASIGKWHLGREGFFPEQHGFDVNVGGAQWGSHVTMTAPYKNNRPNIPNSPPGEYLTDRLTDEAIKFIEANRARPFFLYLPHYAVHTPIQGKPELVERFKNKGDRGEHDNAEYAAMISSVDEGIGRIVERLGALGLMDNTIVVFTSDNGGLEKITSNTPLREGKGTAYEGGIRVPLIIKWPAQARRGIVSDVPVHSNDLFPTFAEGAGIKVPRKVEIDGVSLRPLLTTKGTFKREAIFLHYPHYNAHTPVNTCTPHGIIRQGHWKLIEFFEDGRLELYNLKTDLGETTNLATAEPKKKSQMAKALRDWRKKVGAQMPTPNPNADPVAFREFKEKRLWKPIGNFYEQHTSFPTK
ncbi:MAG: sulfatase [Limisphaerales bacterium]